MLKRELQVAALGIGFSQDCAWLPCTEIFLNHLIKSGCYIFLLIKVQYTIARSQLGPDASRCKFVVKRSISCLPKRTPLISLFVQC